MSQTSSVPGKFKILFDAKSSQVQVELENNCQKHGPLAPRLTTLFDAIKAKGWDYATSSTSGAALNAGDLKGYQVLCILTRLRQTAPGGSNPFPPNADFQYQEAEIAAIVDFVASVGGLLLISNHGPMPNNVRNDQTINDRNLAKAFGITMAPAHFRSPGHALDLSGACLSSAPAIAKTILADVSAVMVHNCCAITPGSVGTPIVSLPEGVRNISPTNSDSPEGKVYALALNHGQGRVIIAGNSGIAGNSNSTYPAMGMIDTADNKTFLLNCLAYLGKLEIKA